MLKRFNEVFGISENPQLEQKRFVERINQTAFDHVEKLAYPVHYRTVFEAVCYALGTNAKDRISEVNPTYFGTSAVIPRLRTLTSNNFIETLKVLEILHQCLYKAPDEQRNLSEWIEAALSHASADVGASWKDGLFYPSGAEELDEKLIGEPLEWLRRFPNERADFHKALTAYLAKDWGEVVINCYLTVEGMARNVLNNKKTLDNNREELLRKIGLSQEWKALLNNFTTYANEFKRHASEKRHTINPNEVEAFLYMSGLLVRLMAAIP